MNSKSNQCTIILGMHRSGTSMLSGCLNMMGVNLGTTIMGADISNETGHFENQDIVLTHDILLHNLGCRWDMIGNFPEGWDKSKAAEKASKTLKDIIKQQFSNNGPFILKDPRMCRLMPLWIPLLNDMDINPCFVIIIRHPMEVALSLQKRNGFDLLKGHLLWVVHNRDALNACRSQIYTIVTFDQLLSDPFNLIRKITNLPSLPNFDPQQHTHKILALIRPDLKHQNQIEQPESKNTPFTHYAWVYDQVRNIQTHTSSSLENIENKNGKELIEADKFADFFIPMPVTSLTQINALKNIKFFYNNLLSVISHYEQANLSHSMKMELLFLNSKNIAEELFLQIFFPNPESHESIYTEDQSLKTLMVPDEWNHIIVDIPRPEFLSKYSLRLDPLNTKGMVSVSEIKMVNVLTGNMCWSAQEKFFQLKVVRDTFVLSSNKILEVVCTGNDPQILLPQIPNLSDSPTRLEIWIKPSRNQTNLKELWDKEMQNHKNLIEKYYSSLVRAEQEQEQYREYIQRIKDEIKGSIQWKVGNIIGKIIGFILLQNSKPMLIDQPQQINIQAKNIENNFLCSSQKAIGKKQSNSQQLTTWIRQLGKDFKLLKSSLRWKTGNCLVRVIEFLLLRPKQPLATDKLEEIFVDFEVRSEAYLADNQDEQKKRLIMTIGSYCKAIKVSKRWKVADAIFSTIDILLLRGRRKTAMDNIQIILSDFEAWQNKN